MKAQTVLKRYTKHAAKAECGVDNAQSNTCAGILLLEILHRQLEDKATIHIHHPEPKPKPMPGTIEPHVGVAYTVVFRHI